MSYISDSVRKNAKKCEECAILKMGSNIDKKGVMHEEAQVAADGVLKLSCTLCPFAKDYESVNGRKPFEK
ncbi:MAG: hypothetical protein GY754_20875 [bacterium]|nr:hypothetical protein [bacterium]